MYWAKGITNVIGTDPPPAVTVETTLESSNSSQQEFSELDKRTTQLTMMWAASQISCPPGIDWNTDKRIRTKNKAYSQFYYHESAGEGQFAYVIVSRRVERATMVIRRS